MDTDVAVNAEGEWEITLGADLGNKKIYIPAVRYPEVLGKG